MQLPNLEAVIYDSRHNAVTMLGSLGRMPREIALGVFRSTFDQEFGPGYTCEVSEVFEDGHRNPLADWSF
jgi:hypothetical protein